MILAPLLLAVLLNDEVDLREHYDVLTYRLDVEVHPERKVLSGTGAVELSVLADELSVVQLDLGKELEVERVVLLEGALDGERALDGREIAHEHAGDELRCRLPEPARKGERVSLAITYAGTPRREDGFTGFHWAKTGDQPWIGTSCQGIGAYTWWPCKSSFFHPEDKHERLFVNLTVPRDLTAVSNGKLVARLVPREGVECYHWVHPYPCETYAVTINVAPYEELVDSLELPGLDAPLRAAYFVLPENVKKAELQFADVPGLLTVYSEAFGSWPFPESKFSLVETSFWGMEHSTAVAYGSSYPAWCREYGVRDKYAGFNRYFDYILVHEVAHEWWGNAVSASSWGHFWIHEGFATYAEAIYLERTQGPEIVDEYFRGHLGKIGKRSRLFRAKDRDDHPSSGEAYSTVVYYKGAWVLHTLRQIVADDGVWWKTLRDFNLAFRYGNASTDDFRALLEKNTGRSFERFFDEWVYGEGYPELEGEVRVEGRTLVVDVKNDGSAKTDFHVPLPVAWTEDGERKIRVFELEPGENHLTHECGASPTDVEVEGLKRILGHHHVTVK